ncbi:MAG: AMP-binding protein, partial [Rhodocyclaceae bacterium]|nr:AMP-binding protein [Rhodocyclaceae bacterium]
MEKIWLKSYPEGVPADIDHTRYESLAHLLEESFRNYADKPAFACMGKSITYGELDRMSRDFAAWLQADGLKPGSRVAVMMPNVLQYPVAVAGILRAGCILVNVNPLYTARELEHQLKDSGAEAIVILENFAHLLEKVQSATQVRHVVVAAMGDLLGGLKGTIVNFVVRRVKKMVPPFRLDNAIGFKQALAGGRAAAFTQPRIGQEDVAVLQYTGGTTGVAKGATLVHRNLLSNVLQSEAWMQPAFQRVAPGEQMITITALPLYHIFA